VSGGTDQTAPSLAVSVGGLRLKNPVMTASGPFGYGQEWVGLAPWCDLGALVLKTITKEPRAGSPPNARIMETPAGMLNSIGLENVGIDAFLAEKLPAARDLGTQIIASIGGESVEEFVELAQRLEEAGDIAALELNISCPNVHAGGMAFGVDPVMAASVVGAVKTAVRLPVIPKLTPNVTDIASIAQACEGVAADAIALINTFSGMVIDIHSRRPVLAANTGGLSGPAIRPAAVLRVYQVARAVSIPVIGMGGIMTAADALEFIIAGATAVQVGTALFIDPLAAHRILAGIEDFLCEQRLGSVMELVGSLVRNTA
jgi:dihydroorotate dehydrogenase (NAD+) catalytic subunit